MRIKNLIFIIKHGNREEVTNAKKEIELRQREIKYPLTKPQLKEFEIFIDEMKSFEEIKDHDHQAYFINTLKWPFLFFGKDYFDFLADFIVKQIQHPSGKVRRAIVKATDWLMLDCAWALFNNDLTRHSEKQKEQINKVKNGFCGLVFQIEQLLSKYHKPRYEKYKYINSLPPGVYKSLQQLIIEVLLRNEKCIKIYENYLMEENHPRDNLSNGESGKINEEKIDQQTLQKRKAVESDLEKLFNSYGISKKLTVKMIKDWIWNDEGETAIDASGRFQKKIFHYFAHIKDIDELNKILQIFSSAWNYFPHRSLNGKSPNQMVQQALKENPDLRKKDDQKMPDFIISGHKIPWDKYWAMMREMEKQQIPFKNWIEKEALPKYKKYLKSVQKNKLTMDYYQVADIFFNRALQLGFIKFDQLRINFIQKEFPRWWQTHVIGIELTDKQIRLSLKHLFVFLELVFDIEIKKFGF